MRESLRVGIVDSERVGLMTGIYLPHARYQVAACVGADNGHVTNPSVKRFPACRLGLEEFLDGDLAGVLLGSGGLWRWSGFPIQGSNLDVLAGKEVSS